MTGDDSLRWYDSSPKAQRGFCSNCGGNLFWRPLSGTHISIMAGTIDLPTGIRAIEHIYVGSKADYHDIEDGLPQHEEEFMDNSGELEQ